MRQSFYVLYLILGLTLTFSSCTKNPEYKNFYVVNNDTIAEIFLPKGSEDGALILWNKGINMDENQIEEICNKLVSPEQCIRKTTSDVFPKTYPSLYVYSKNKNFTDESMYLSESNADNYLYKFTGRSSNFRFDGDDYGYLESKKEIKYGSLSEFREGQKFKLNGKMVEVARSSQLYICFYSSERLMESETLLIKVFLRKYGKSFTIYDSEKMKHFSVDPAKRTNLYFFDTWNTDFRCMSDGNYISITGNTITDFIHDTFKNAYEVESIVKEGKDVEDYFEFIKDND